MIARVAAWLLVAIALVIVFDVVTRRLLAIPSLALQELEWHLYAVLFALSLGYALLRDSHVRIDVLRERLGWRARAWIDVLGTLLLLLPFCAVLLHYTADYAWGAFVRLEGSRMPGGLPYRFVVKAMIPAGIVLLMLAALATLLRNLRLLRHDTAARRSGRP